jgi:hypothetical protein
METMKRVSLAKGRLTNELHALRVIEIKNNRLDEGCQFLHGDSYMRKKEDRNWAGACPVPLRRAEPGSFT